MSTTTWERLEQATRILAARTVALADLAARTRDLPAEATKAVRLEIGVEAVALAAGARKALASIEDPDTAAALWVEHQVERGRRSEDRFREAIAAARAGTFRPSAVKAAFKVDAEPGPTGPPVEQRLQASLDALLLITDAVTLPRPEGA